jgi:hypothetical protein
MPSSLVTALLVSIPILVVGILLAVVTFARRVQARRRAALEAEGIVLDTGPQRITVRLENFHGGGVSHHKSTESMRAALVLTGKRFVLTPSGRAYYDVPREMLGRYTVGAADGELQIHSDNPAHATGSIDYRVKLSDASAWVDALVAAGAKRA